MNVLLDKSIPASGPLSVVASGIAVTPDTISTVLHERRPTSDGTAAAGWFGITITIWVAYLSATFHDALEMKAAVIESIFVICGVLSMVATLISSIRWLINGHKYSVENTVKEIILRSRPKVY